MFKFVRSRTLFAALVCLLAVAGAHAQSSSTPLSRQMEHIDLGLSAPYELTRSSSGRGITQSVSTASGFLGTLRYTHSPFIGAEMNYKKTRFTQNYVYPFSSQKPGGGTIVTPVPLGVEANVIEYSWGYVAHTPSTYFGFKPFGGVGLGSLEFRPTPNGGQSLIRQFRAVYYWDIGADYQLGSPHFGARVAMRQIFYIAPDFGQNYLTSGARTSTFEPSAGFYLHF